MLGRLFLCAFFVFCNVDVCALEKVKSQMKFVAGDLSGVERFEAFFLAAT